MSTKYLQDPLNFDDHIADLRERHPAIQHMPLVACKQTATSWQATFQDDNGSLTLEGSMKTTRKYLAERKIVKP